MKEWRTERSGWRDEALSERHGYWGFHCPAVDIDFLMVEYNWGKPCALVEYKHKCHQILDPNHSNYRALVDLADKYSDGPLACFIAVYDPDDWSFEVIPLNEESQQRLAHCAGKILTEQRFVYELYKLRKTELTADDEAAVKQCNNFIINR